MKRFIRLYFSIIFGILLGITIAYYGFVKAPNAPMTQGIAGTPIGGSLAGLLDQNGVTVDDARFAGKAQLVFFGFTHCPSICPTELQKITVTLKKLSEGDRAKLAPIFISVDPERDTPDVMKNYLAMFDPAITGLTGTPDQIAKIKSDWKVYSSKSALGADGDYTVDHSAYTYFRGADGALIALFSGTDGAGIMASKVKEYLD